MPWRLDRLLDVVHGKLQQRVIQDPERGGALSELSRNYAAHAKRNARISREVLGEFSGDRADEVYERIIGGLK